MFSIFHHLKRIKVSRGCILVSFRRKIPIGFRFAVLLEAVLRVCHASFSIWAASWQNQQSECAPSEDRSAWASAQSDQSLRCPHEETLGP